jgi:hypothetical protein
MKSKTGERRGKTNVEQVEKPRTTTRKKKCPFLLLLHWK